MKNFSMSIDRPRYKTSLHGLSLCKNVAEYSPAGEVPLWEQYAAYRPTLHVVPLVIGMKQAKVRTFPWGSQEYCTWTATPVWLARHSQKISSAAGTPGYMQITRTKNGTQYCQCRAHRLATYTTETEFRTKPRCCSYTELTAMLQESIKPDTPYITSTSQD